MTDTSPSSLAGGTSGDTFARASASQAGRTFIERALAQDGDRYVFGHEVKVSDQDPDVFDCSELVQWAAAQAGVEITDGSWLQYRHVRQHGGAMDVEEALNTPGALLFSFGSDPDAGGRPRGAHVAISLGDGRTIEARGSKYGVGIFDATNRNWTHAGVIPELAGATLGPPQVTEDIDPLGDTDGDGILDRYETLVGTDPFRADTDGDGFIDSVEVLDYGTSPLDAMDNPRDRLREEMGLEALGKVVQDPVPLGLTDRIEFDGPSPEDRTTDEGSGGGSTERGQEDDQDRDEEQEQDGGAEERDGANGDHTEGGEDDGSDGTDQDPGSEESTGDDEGRDTETTDDEHEDEETIRLIEEDEDSTRDTSTTDDTRLTDDPDTTDDLAGTTTEGEDAAP